MRSREKNYKREGNNRIILATDGDFNIGASSNAEMERLIEEKRKEGVFLSVLGFGMGNYKDDKMEILANKGNGNYAYIHNLREAKKVFVHEFGGTLFTIAQDVKLQIEFNPAYVQAFRLIGYENRVLNHEDFKDDEKDAGELGSGHSVTALYEIIPVGVESEFVRDIDPLKYQADQQSIIESQEIMNINVRYKDPGGTASRLQNSTVLNTEQDWRNTSENFKWSAAVASFGMLLRESKFIQQSSTELTLELAQGSSDNDEGGYKSEFMDMVESFQYLNSNN